MSSVGLSCVHTARFCALVSSTVRGMPTICEVRGIEAVGCVAEDQGVREARASSRARSRLRCRRLVPPHASTMPPVTTTKPPTSDDSYHNSTRCARLSRHAADPGRVADAMGCLVPSVKSRHYAERGTLHKYALPSFSPTARMVPSGLYVTEVSPLPCRVGRVVLILRAFIFHR